MSQLDTPPFDASAGGPQKTSGLAIASLVCSLICCIPITTILGILLGIGAMISIGGDPAKKGKGMAITGIVLGVLFTAGQALIYPPAYGYIKKTMELVWSGPSGALTAGFAGDLAGFKAEFYGAGESASDVEAQAFINQLRTRYGEYVGCRFDEQSGQPSQPGFGDASVEFPYILEFANGEVNALAEVVFSDAQKGGFINKLGFITVIDADLGDLTYPAPSAAEVEGAMEGAIEGIQDAMEGLEQPPGGDGG